MALALAMVLAPAVSTIVFAATLAFATAILAKAVDLPVSRPSALLAVVHIGATGLTNWASLWRVESLAMTPALGSICSARRGRI